MKVKGLDGRTYTLSCAGKQPDLDDERTRSAPHLRCRALLARLYPLEVRAEEVELPGTGLFVDFILPFRRLVVEVDGIQHREFTPFFHPTPLNFLGSNLRDRKKEEWCDLNNFRLARLPDDLDDDEWVRILCG